MSLKRAGGGGAAATRVVREARRRDDFIQQQESATATTTTVEATLENVYRYYNVEWDLAEWTRIVDWFDVQAHKMNNGEWIKQLLSKKKKTFAQKFENAERACAQYLACQFIEQNAYTHLAHVSASAKKVQTNIMHAEKQRKGNSNSVRWDLFEDAVQVDMSELMDASLDKI